MGWGNNKTLIRKSFIEEINKAGIPDVTVLAEESEKCGIKGTHFKVTVEGQEEESHDDHQYEHHHHHTSMAEIEAIIKSLNIPEIVKAGIIEVYKLIAAAEINAHGKPVTDIHFHEVGTIDAIADITSVCLLFNKIGAKNVFASAINVGSGQVHCAHGILPVPAPQPPLS